MYIDTSGLIHLKIVEQKYYSKKSPLIGSGNPTRGTPTRERDATTDHVSIHHAESWRHQL